MSGRGLTIALSKRKFTTGRASERVELNERGCAGERKSESRAEHEKFKVRRLHWDGEEPAPRESRLSSQNIG